MIQRIQTVYLAMAAIFAGIFAFYNEYAWTLWSKLGALQVAGSILALVVALIALVTIFLFNNRKIQTTLIGLNYLVLLAALVVYVWNDSVTEFFKDWTFYCLLMSFVALFMAKKGVKADEELIRSADRLR
jgi:peptidoglycan/LPS O-acetylase OafA/YrhL